LEEVVRDAELGKLRADKLVRVHCLDGVEEWLLIHVEVQSQPDPRLPQRMYEYHHRIMDRYGRPVVSMAVLADERRDWRPAFYQHEHWGCRLRFEYLICKLIDIPAQQLEQQNNAAALVIAAHLSTQRTNADTAERKLLKWQLTRRLYERGYAKRDVLEIFRLIDWLMVLPESLTIAFREELVQYEQQETMRHLTSIEELALKEGREEGLQEGQQVGQCRIIKRLLERRWGRVSADVEQRVRALSSEQLEVLAEALLDFRSPADLEAWLRDRQTVRG
jgi:hypothetical protein